MGAPKQKWTTAEEAALRAGVRKHGLGKWRAIQKDPEFTFLLATRSNVDLKVSFFFVFHHFFLYLFATSLSVYLLGKQILHQETRQS